MISRVFDINMNETLIFFTVMVSFIISLVSIRVFSGNMPRDNGRAYAVNGTISKGKPRGIGAIFIVCFIIMMILFLPFSLEMLMYTGLMFITMLSGFFDDKSLIPWNEYKKGGIDLLIATFTSFIFLSSKPKWGIMLTTSMKLPPLASFFLSIIIIWVAINVTNCSDGVDGLCGSLSIISLITIAVIIQWKNPVYVASILMLVSCILGYLWYNVSPSSLLMGDAGSRAIGYYLGVVCIKFLPIYVILLVAFVIFIDGGIGLFKVAVLRFLKIRILKTVRTPLHDYVRKDKHWSDGQVVFRFSIIQILISSATVFFFIYY